MKQRWLAAALLLLVPACSKKPPALPDPIQIQEFRIPWENAFPSDVAVDERGRLWFTDRYTHAIGVFDPETNNFTRYPTPTERSAPYGMVRLPDGSLWFAESMKGRLGRVDVKTGAITEFAIPELPDGGPHLLAYANGRIWFTARNAMRWGWFDPRTQEARSFAFVTGIDSVTRRYASARPYSIAPARGGGAWIGTYDGAYLMRARPGVDTLEQHILRRALPEDTALRRRFSEMPDSVRRRFRVDAGVIGYDAVGARRSATDGRGSLWLADFTKGRAVRYDPAEKGFDVHATLQRTCAPYGIAVDRFDRVWFSCMQTGELVMLDQQSGTRAIVRVGHTGAAIRHITFDEQRGRVWLPISDAGTIGLLRLK